MTENHSQIFMLTDFFCK